MYLKRKVYDQLLDWKNDTVHSTLEVNGDRKSTRLNSSHSH